MKNTGKQLDWLDYREGIEWLSQVIKNLSYTIALWVLTATSSANAQSVQDGNAIIEQTIEASQSEEQLKLFLFKYIESELAEDYLFYLNDPGNILYRDLRLSDAVDIIKMYEEDGVLQEWQMDKDSRRVVVGVIAWFTMEDTADTVRPREAAIRRLHRIAPETTKRAIAHAALAYPSIEEGNFTPWSIAVNALWKYDVNIRGIEQRDVSVLLPVVIDSN